MPLRRLLIHLGLGLCAALLLGAPALAEDDPDDAPLFNDAPLPEGHEHPSWFERSFLHLGEDLEEAVAAGKSGLIVYFGQPRCPYCRMMLEHNWGMADIVAYTRQHFDVVGLNIWGAEELTDLQGQAISVRDFALREDANFTPSLIFYDAQGRQALMLRGYYPPYKFRAALEYVAGGHYQREPFLAFLERGDATLTFEPGELNEEPFFAKPPHQLDRSRHPGERPLVVFFERGDCHACNVLHAQTLRDPALLSLFHRFDAVQLDIGSQQPLITPDGQRSTPRDWSRQLGLFYTPSLLFFDEQGREIMRVDSVAYFFRLRAVLNFILSKGYQQQPNFMRWAMQRTED
ncbi:thioredoxin fold domain-containing protein [Magnetovirga frankeli]|uniref:thioredoxin family protein n=1 Tax=Magnetovirga frankeli TaxID=947516 RepID=UPI001292E3CA|nr:thioredoxin fold domain-containing protein [gamma proteobacterium SS-5]